jgi:hypothetical protein
VLTQYLTRTAQLLQNPAAPQGLYNSTDLTSFINEARGQLAGTAECIRSLATLNVTAGVRNYFFTSMSPTAPLGVGSVIHVRTLWQVLGTGAHYIAPRSQPWFAIYNANHPNATNRAGPPDEWAQYGQGVNGWLTLDPIPDQAYSLDCDTVALPLPLATDVDPEAIPSLWTDAVPFLAAWFALLASQTGARSAEADKMLERYTTFMTNARRSATPDILPDIWDQSPSPVRQNQLGLPMHGRGQAPPQ